MTESGSLRWGRFIYRNRYLVLAIAVFAVLISGWYGRDLADRLTQEGWFDESSESVAAAKIADDTFGRDTDSDVIALYTAPEGTTVDDPAVRAHAKRCRARQLLLSQDLDFVIAGVLVEKENAVPIVSAGVMVIAAHFQKLKLPKAPTSLRVADPGGNF